MLLIHPESVRFAGVRYERVTAVAVERSATRLIEDRGDNGPFAEFVDVPEQRVTVRLTQEVAVSDIPGPELGAAGLLEVWVAATRSDAGRMRVLIDAVVSHVRYDLTPPPAAGSAAAASGRGGPTATRTITFTAYSIDGRADPVATLPAEVGPD